MLSDADRLIQPELLDTLSPESTSQTDLAFWSFSFMYLQALLS